MQWTGLNELRDKFLNFFEQRGHYRFDSFPLVPTDDKSLLLINSGMAPLKKYFLGQEHVPGNIATSCQKCIRTPDIDNVGITARHGTFFEMLGNFSFAEYFKEEAIDFAYDFFIKELEIPLDRLYFSVYEQDDEAYDIWTKKQNIPSERMVRFGKEDNFWEIGAGPCGPCSEIYFDRGSQHGCDKPDCKVGCDCDRYVEVWNLVFTQFISDGKGNYDSMEHGNIDTGMGLERLACVMQDVDNLFEVDTIKSIISMTENLSGYSYKTNKDKDISVRVITDHIRSTVFLVGDGVLPSNEGRGYVLRRLLRRAARHGRLLGIKGAFLQKLSETVIDLNKGCYPELSENADYIKKVIGIEEERFAKTIDSGSSLLMDEIEKLKNSGGKILSGAVAFKLSDTFGFPLDLTKEILAEQSLELDEKEFKALLQKQKDTAREARAKQGDASWAEEVFSDKGIIPTLFSGYEILSSTSTVMGLAVGGELAESVSTLVEPIDDIAVILDTTPFYAEGGGEVGDTGVFTADGLLMDVLDTVKISGGLYLHKCRLVNGSVSEGMKLTAKVDEGRRNAIRRNHTSAHLLQQALIEVLGDHVHQAGSYVDDTRVRFDFTHFSQMTDEEIRAVEDKVNNVIFQNITVTAEEMPIEKAKELGAQALFGEKYGDVVRVVTAQEYSVEFCGGCHVSNTSQIGCFKLLSESSVAAGVRRIEATTGIGVVSYIKERDALLLKCSEIIKLNNPSELPNKITAMATEIKEKDAVINSLKSAAAASQLTSIINGAMNVEGITLFAGVLENVDANTLRECCSGLKSRSEDSVVFLVSTNSGKVSMAASCGKGAIEKGKSSGMIIKSVATKFDGNGGGKPDFAMGGLKSAENINSIISEIHNLI